MLNGDRARLILKSKAGLERKVTNFSICSTFVSVVGGEVSDFYFVFLDKNLLVTSYELLTCP